MKSSFLFALMFASLVTSVWSQTTTTPALPGAPTEKSSFDKFYDRLKINYFGAYQSSSLGQWDNLALDEKGQKDPTYAQNLFNQVSFNYNFGAKMNFVLNPRWTVYTGGTSTHSRESNGVIVVEDALAGFQGVIFSNADKKFNWWMRTAARLPTSRASRRNDITFQPDFMNILSYDFDTTWQLGSYVSFRQWAYENRFTAFRYRVYVAPYIQYTVNDTTRWQLYYENYSEKRGPNGNGTKFQEYWQNTMIAYSKDITPKFNFMPFIGYFLNTTYAADRPLDAAWVGFWASYAIK